MAFICQRAVLLCVKAAARTPDDLDVAITAEHLREAVTMRCADGGRRIEW